MLFFPHHVCRTVGHLGSGQFANVEEGTWKKGVNKEVGVALKAMKPGTTEEDKIKFLQDAAIMARREHVPGLTVHLCEIVVKNLTVNEKSIHCSARHIS